MTMETPDGVLAELTDDELAELYRHIEQHRRDGIVDSVDIELQSHAGFQLFKRGYALDEILPPELREQVAARHDRYFRS